MVDVPHDGDDRSAGGPPAAGLLLLGTAGAGELLLELHLLLEGDDHGLDAELAGQRLRQLGVQHLVDVGPRASACASSGSSTWLMLAMMPRLNSEFIRSRTRTPSFSANSRRVIPSLIITAPALVS